MLPYKIIHALIACCLPLCGYNDAPSLCCPSLSSNSYSAGCVFPEEPILGEEQLGDFRSDLLHLIDSRHQVFLFRGNLPEHNKEIFCYDDLVEGIKGLLEQQGVIISDDFKILDISFLNYFFDSAEIEVEREWFNHNPSKGAFSLNPLYGALVNPTYLPESVRNLVLQHHDIDGLKMLMYQLKTLMEASYPTDFVIYLHCNVGKDRTGEAAACYLMQYMDYSYKDVIALSEKIAKRGLRMLSMNAIRWYAFFLRDIQNMDWIGDID